MFRVCLFVSAFTLASAAAAADLPKNISAEDRADFLTELKLAYAADRSAVLVKVEEAKTLAQFKATEKEGKKKLADAEAELARMDKDPLAWAVPKKGSISTIGAKPPKGRIGYLNAGGVWTYTVAEATADGAVIDGLFKVGTDTDTARYLVASKIDVPKTKGKLPPEVKLPGLWYVAGTADVKGKPVPVLYRFALKAEDITAKKPDKK